ncbi:MAG: hypothetical protein WD845_11140 [Pirellulales bacterium]
MATLKIPAIKSTAAENGCNNGANSKPTGNPPEAAIKAALAILLEGLGYAEDLKTESWEFAVELSSLRRLRLSNNDLRWLLARGMIEHAVEVAGNGGSGRTFRKRARAVFGKRSCFILTGAGATLARELRGATDSIARTIAIALPQNGISPSVDSADAAPADRWASGHASGGSTPTPRWDRDRHELRFGLQLVKRFTLPSPDQESVLAAFEEQHWPARIDDPWLSARSASEQARLLATIQRLNQGQRLSLIRFGCDGGRSVLWQLDPKPVPAQSLPLSASSDGS